MKAQAVLFDMDGLLLDTERLIVECFALTQAAFSLEPDTATIVHCIGRGAGESEQIIRQSLGNSGLSGEDSYRAFMAELERLIQARFAEGIPVKQGAHRLLQHLAQSGFPMGIATSTQSDRARDRLESAGLLQYFTHIVGGDQVTRHKPDPETYLRVAELLGVSAENCIAFEDSAPGTRAAIASGARTVQVPDLVQPSEELRKLGHIIAPTLIEGARRAGLISDPIEVID